MENSADSKQEGDSITAGDMHEVEGAAIGRQSSAAANTTTINNNFPPANIDNPSLADMIRMTWTQGLATQSDLSNLEQNIANLPTRHDVQQLKGDIRRLQEESRKAAQRNAMHKRTEEEERRRRQQETDQHRAMLTTRMSKLEGWFKGWTIVIVLLCGLDLYLIFDLAKRLGWLGFV